jgi:hypothetical protein
VRSADQEIRHIGNRKVGRICPAGTAGSLGCPLEIKFLELFAKCYPACKGIGFLQCSSVVFLM